LPRHSLSKLDLKTYELNYTNRFLSVRNAEDSFFLFARGPEYSLPFVRSLEEFVSTRGQEHPSVSSGS
jgi:hypothetical protein